MLRLKKSNHDLHWPSAFQFGLSSIAAVTLLGIGISTALVGVAWHFNRSTPSGSATQFSLLATGILFSGLLLVPSAGFALIRLLGLAGRFQGLNLDIPVFRPSILILALPVVLVAGYRVNQMTDWNWLLLPPLHILAVGIPLLWLVYLGKRGLSTGSPQQTWGVFGSGLILSPLLIMIVELAAGAFLIALGAIYLFNRPELLEELSSLAERLSQAPPDPAVYQRILTPLLNNAGVIALSFLFIAIIVPLIEELLKPIGVWLLVGRDLTPATGFAAGLLSGAGYALFESLAFTSNTNEWSFVVTARIGTGVIHILTAGLTGWALATAWRERRYARLGVAYLTAVLLHGLWNGLTLLASGSQITGNQLGRSPFLASLAGVAPIGLGILALTAFAILLVANRTLANQPQQTHLKMEADENML